MKLGLLMYFLGLAIATSDPKGYDLEGTCGDDWLEVEFKANFTNSKGVFFVTGAPHINRTHRAHAKKENHEVLFLSNEGASFRLDAKNNGYFSQDGSKASEVWLGGCRIKNIK